MNRIYCVALALILALPEAACSRRLSFEGIQAPTLESQKPVSLQACSTKKCLTVYVAPWCPYCRQAIPLISALRDYLKKQGVSTRVVVGMDKESAVRDYARNFGPDTFLDPEGRFSPPGGVPSFLVSDSSGKVLSHQNGVLPIEPPFSESTLSEIASSYGLP